MGQPVDKPFLKTRLFVNRRFHSTSRSISQDDHCSLSLEHFHSVENADKIKSRSLAVAAWTKKSFKLSEFDLSWHTSCSIKKLKSNPQEED